MRPETIAVRTQIERSSNNEHSVPLFLTSSYVFEDAEDMRSQFSEEKEGHIYSRYANPNVEELIQKVSQLEGAENGWATATGMAAVFTTFTALLEAGDHVVASHHLFGSSLKLLNEILPKWQINTTYVNALDFEEIEHAFTAQTKVFFIETPSNPTLQIFDLERIAKICHSKGILLIVDNCFATPILQQPIRLGADIVIHSATKYLDGQGRTLGGLILSSNDIIAKIKAFARHSGPALSPFNAWVISKSIETLPLRMEKHSSNALEIAKRLEAHPKVKQVFYPHLESHPQYEIAKQQMSLGGGIIAFEIEGGIEAGARFLDSLQLFSLTANLGDTRSIATHPASTTHSKVDEKDRIKVGILDGTIRLSIGLEHVEDIWEDLENSIS